MKILFLVVWCGIFMTSSLFAQKDTLQAFQQRQEADQLVEEDELKQAISLYRSATKYYKDAEAWESWLSTLNSLAICLYNTQAYSELVANLEQEIITAKEELGSQHFLISQAQNRLGISYTALGQYEKALQSFQSEISILEQVKDESHPDLHTAYNNLGFVYGEMGKKQQAIQTYHKTLKLREKHDAQNLDAVAGTYSNLGVAYGSAGDYEKSLAYIRKSVSLFEEIEELDEMELAREYYNLGSCLSKLGYHEEQAAYFQKSIKILKRNIPEPHPFYTFFYLGLGDAYSEKGDHSESIIYYQKALSIQQQIYGETHPNLGNTYNNLGAAYSFLEDDEKAIDYYEQAKKIYEAALAVHHYKTGRVYENMARIYLRMGKTKQAIKSAQKAVNIQSHNAEEFPMLWSDANANLGFLYRQIQEYEIAHQYFQQASEALAQFPDRHPEKADIYIKEAYTFFDQGELEAALRSIQQALISMHERFSSYDFAQNPSSDGCMHLPYLQEALSLKGQILLHHYHQHPKAQNLDACLATLEKGREIGDEMRQSFEAEASKIALRNELHEVYEYSIEAALLKYEQSDDEKWLEQAFRFSEESKAMVLLEVLKQSEARNFAGLPRDLLEKEKRLRHEWRLYEGKWQEERIKGAQADSSKLKRWFALHFERKNQYEQLVQQLERDYPQYYELKYTQETISISQIRKQLLGKGEAMISYFWGTEKLYAFLISAEQLAARRISLPSDKILAFRELYNHASSPNPQEDFQQFCSLGSDLYDELLGKLLSQSYAKIRILPDGLLHYLPFELLLTEGYQSKDVDYRPLPYLLQQSTISYALSATLLHTAQQSAPTQARLNYVGFAPIYPAAEGSNKWMAFREHPTPLSGTEEEVEFAAALFGGQKYVGKAASEQHFKQFAPQAKILHLAMHALVNDQDALQSCLLFSPTTDSIDTQALAAWEIYNMELASELAVLSACNTGLGKIQRGEGMMSLSRAFMYAGCPSIIMSLWRAQDQATLHIMEDFYVRLKAGKAKDEALTQAKRNYLQQADKLQSHPAYWATFVAQGDMQPLPSSNKQGRFWLVAIAVLLSLSSILIWRRRRNGI